VNDSDNPSVASLVVQLLLEYGVATPDKILECSEEEVSRVESKFGLVLPVVYREFLLAREGRPVIFSGARIYFFLDY
jgi:hypothetical protein